MFFFKSRKKRNRKIKVKLSGLVSEQTHTLKLTPNIKRYGDLKGLIVGIIGQSYYTIQVGAPPQRRSMRIPYEYKYLVNGKEVSKNKIMSKNISEIEVLIHNRGHDQPLCD